MGKLSLALGAFWTTGQIGMWGILAARPGANHVIDAAPYSIESMGPDVQILRGEERW